MGFNINGLLHVSVHVDTVDRSSILFGLPAGAYGAGNSQMEQRFNISQVCCKTVLTTDNLRPSFPRCTGQPPVGTLEQQSGHW
jgi:hypothetical protein